MRAQIVCFALLFNVSSMASSAVEADDVKVVGPSVYSREIPHDDTVTIGKLDNGLTYYIKQDQHFSKTHVELVINAGVGDEDRDQIGLAHLLEHLAHSWSDDYPNQQWREFRKRYQLAESTDFNAHTGDATRYWVRVPGGDVATLSDTFDVVRRWLDGMVLTQSRLDHEKPVVLSEVQSTDYDRGSALEIEMVYSLLKSSEYNVEYRKTHDDSIRQASLASLVRFYRDWYRPDLSAIIVIGPGDPKAIEPLIRDRFDTIPRPAAPRAKLNIESRRRIKLDGQTQFISKFESRLSGLRYTFYRKAASQTDNDVTVAGLRHELIDEIANKLMRQRLNGAAKVADLGCEVSMNIIPFGGSTTGIDALKTAVSCKDAKSNEEAIRRTMIAFGQIMEYGFSDAEMVRAKRQVKDEQAGDLLSQSFSAKILYDNFLHNWPIVPFDLMQNAKLEELSALSAEKIIGRLRNFANVDRDFDIVVTGAAHFAPVALSESKIFSLIRSNLPNPLPRYVEPVAPTFIMTSRVRDQFRGRHARADAWIDDLGARKFTLADGSDVYFVSDNTMDGDRVSVTGFSRAPCPRGREATCKALNLFAKSAWLSGIDAEQLSLFKKSKDAAILVSADRLQSFIVASAPKKNFENALQLMFLTITDLRPDEHRYESLESEELYETSGIGFIESVDRKLRAERAEPSTTSEDSNTAKSQFAAASQLFNELFRKRRPETFIVSGRSFDQEIIALALAYISALPRRAQMTKNLNLGSVAQESFITTPKTRLIKIPTEIAETLSQKGFVRIHSGGTYEDNLTNRLELELLETMLRMRMFEVLRQNGGGVYAPTVRLERIRSSSAANKFGSYRVEVAFAAPPNQFESLVQLTRDEMSTIARDGFSQDLYDRAIQEATKGSKAAFGDETPTSNLWQSLVRNEDPTALLKRQTLLTSVLNKAALDRAAKRYIHSNNFRVTLITASDPNIHR